jgi:hypothetical protein
VKGVAILVGLAVSLLASIASAYVVVAGAEIPITPAVAQDRAQLGDAVRAAIRDVLDHAVAFTPTVVTLQNARVVGDRLYILLFIANEDGALTIEALSACDDPASERPRPGPVEPSARSPEGRRANDAITPSPTAR